MKDYQIKVASINDLNLMLLWAQQEGWNPGLSDAIPFHVTDPTGFYIGYLNHEPIASISVVRYANLYAFLGFYIVHPAYRGQGYGLKIWQAGMDYLNGYHIGLDGVNSQQPNYRKSGFKLAYQNVRYQGQISNPLLSRRVVNACELPLSNILEYDNKYFPRDRSHFITAWLHMPNSYSLAIVENNTIQGLGVIRKCHHGYKIGPLYAETESIADELASSLAHHADAEIIIDVPAINPHALRLVERFHLKPCFETARMYTGSHQPEIDLNHLYGVTTFELG